MTARGDRDHSVVLHQIEAADADRVHEWASQERACRFQPWGPNTREQTGDFVSEAVRTWERPGGPRLVWAASSALGFIGMGEIKRHTTSCADIAYAVHVAYWGRGLGTQIARLLLAIAFANPAVERVQGTCDPRNLASAAVLRRAGLTFEGTLRRASSTTGPRRAFATRSCSSGQAVAPASAECRACRGRSPGRLARYVASRSLAPLLSATSSVSGMTVASSVFQAASNTT
jgi:ribosomal-protein-alanine N-acetyltransferase